MSDARQAVLAQIKAQKWDAERSMYECGCHQCGKRWWLCQYHDGYEDGYDDAAEEVLRLREALTAAEGACVIECDADCEARCHMGHVVSWRRPTGAVAAASDGEADNG